MKTRLIHMLADYDDVRGSITYGVKDTHSEEWLLNNVTGSVNVLR